jgi:hypothetical protein
MEKTYRITRESANLICIEIIGEIGLEFLREFWDTLEALEEPVCILLHNTQETLASLATVSLLYKSAQDPRLKAVAAYDLTSAQLSLVQWVVKTDKIDTFRVFGNEEEARAYLAGICGA